MNQERETSSSEQYENKRGFKTTAKYTTVATALTTVMFTLIELFTAVEFDAGFQGSVTTLIVALFAYLAPPRKTGKRGKL